MLIDVAPGLERRGNAVSLRETLSATKPNPRSDVVFPRFGGHSVSKTPGSIPNPAVKCHRANGTASQDVGE